MASCPLLAVLIQHAQEWPSLQGVKSQVSNVEWCGVPSCHSRGQRWAEEVWHPTENKNETQTVPYMVYLVWIQRKTQKHKRQSGGCTGWKEAALWVPHAPHTAAWVWPALYHRQLRVLRGAWWHLIWHLIPHVDQRLALGIKDNTDSSWEISAGGSWLVVWCEWVLSPRKDKEANRPSEMGREKKKNIFSLLRTGSKFPAQTFIFNRANFFSPHFKPVNSMTENSSSFRLELILATALYQKY